MHTSVNIWLRKLLGGPAVVTRCLVLESSEYQSLERLVKQGFATRRAHKALPAWEYEITQKGLEELGYENHPIEPPKVGDRREGQSGGESED